MKQSFAIIIRASSKNAGYLLGMVWVMLRMLAADEPYMKTYIFKTLAPSGVALQAENGV